VKRPRLESSLLIDRDLDLLLRLLWLRESSLLSEEELELELKDEELLDFDSCSSELVLR
jgi:hypothetical protein